MSPTRKKLQFYIQYFLNKKIISAGNILYLKKVYSQSYSVTTKKLSKPDVGKSSAIFSLFSNLFCSINLTSFANALSSEDSSSIFCTVEPTVFESYCILSNEHNFLRLQKIRKGFLTEEVDQNLAKNRPRRKYILGGRL